MESTCQTFIHCVLHKLQHFLFPKVPYFLRNCFSASPGAVKDSSYWICRLASGEISQNEWIAPIAISSEAVSTVVFLSLFQQEALNQNSLPGFWLYPRYLSPARSSIFRNWKVEGCSGALDIVIPKWIDCQVDYCHYCLLGIWSASAICL